MHPRIADLHRVPHLRFVALQDCHLPHSTRQIDSQALRRAPATHSDPSFDSPSPMLPGHVRGQRILAAAPSAHLSGRSADSDSLSVLPPPLAREPLQLEPTNCLEPDRNPIVESPIPFASREPIASTAPLHVLDPHSALRGPSPEDRTSSLQQNFGRVNAHLA